VIEVIGRCRVVKGQSSRKKTCPAPSCPSAAERETSEHDIQRQQQYLDSQPYLNEGVLTAAALMRVFGLSLLGMTYPLVILWAAVFWTMSFALFVGVYSPILWGPRVDGMPG
jgi:hypothetical protein